MELHCIKPDDDMAFACTQIMTILFGWRQTNSTVPWGQLISHDFPHEGRGIVHSSNLLSGNVSIRQSGDTLRPRQNDCHFADDIFKCIFYGNVWISLKISLKFVPDVRINNIPALVQIMAWHHPGDKPLSEPMMFSLPMHISITWPQWVNNGLSHKMFLYYIQRIMHTVCTLLCFVEIRYWTFFPYPSGLLHWHWGYYMIAPVPVR